MKKEQFLAAIAVGIYVLLLCACGKEAHAREVSIDYGESNLYSQEDMDAAIQLIEDTFAGDGWKG